jgi:hypothetical protein
VGEKKAYGEVFPPKKRPPPERGKLEQEIVPLPQGSQTTCGTSIQYQGRPRRRTWSPWRSKPPKFGVFKKNVISVNE